MLYGKARIESLVKCWKPDQIQYWVIMQILCGVIVQMWMHFIVRYQPYVVSLAKTNSKSNDGN